MNTNKNKFVVIASDDNYHLAIREKDLSLIDNGLGPWSWHWHDAVWNGPIKIQVWFKFVPDIPRITPISPSSLSLPDPIEPPDLDELDPSESVYPNHPHH